MPKRKPKMTPAEQHREFVMAARELGTDDDEDAFNRRLKQLASAPPPKSVQKRKAVGARKRRG